MRTTVTLDEDVAVRIKRLQRERQASFKQVLNDLVRMALDAETHEVRVLDVSAALAPRPTGPRLHSLDDVWGILAEDDVVGGA